MRLSVQRALTCVVLLAFFVIPAASAQVPLVSDQERAALHNGLAWETVAPHLPDPQTASAADLETAGDVLHARRFPEDALDYYGYAMKRGGNVSELLNRMGVVRLELHQNALAHELFLRTVRAQKKNAQAWNNLGVTEYAARQYSAAIADYRRAIKYDKKSAVFHSNLGMVYFEKKDIESARLEFETALHLDPHLMDERDMGGMSLHVLGVQDYGALCFEMARAYVRRGDDASTLLWLAKASENGYDIKAPMMQDAMLRVYAKDPRVVLLLRNTKEMRSRVVAVAHAPSLGEPVKLVD